MKRAIGRWLAIWDEVYPGQDRRNLRSLGGIFAGCFRREDPALIEEAGPIILRTSKHFPTPAELEEVVGCLRAIRHVHALAWYERDRYIEGFFSTPRLPVWAHNLMLTESAKYRDEAPSLPAADAARARSMEAKEKTEALAGVIDPQGPRENHEGRARDPLRPGMAKAPAGGLET
ncbi:MAG: hypothetical protein HY556_06085 [Euryarchaeota archaeon]|nr:hypothetical protein [Euryarchaeota archaeon]